MPMLAKKAREKARQKTNESKGKAAEALTNKIMDFIGLSCKDAQRRSRQRDHDDQNICRGSSMLGLQRSRSCRGSNRIVDN